VGARESSSAGKKDLKNVLARYGRSRYIPPGINLRIDLYPKKIKENGRFFKEQPAYFRAGS
jgi:hypothetical protein